jgi:hypothetical protein
VSIVPGLVLQDNWLLVKPADIKSPIDLDRLATSNEVHCAILVSSQDALQLVADYDDLPQTDCDFCGRVRNLPEDVMWLAIASEVLDSTSN